MVNTDPHHECTLKSLKKMYNNNVCVDVCLYHEAQEGKSSGNNYIKKGKNKVLYNEH